MKFEFDKITNPPTKVGNVYSIDSVIRHLVVVHIASDSSYSTVLCLNESGRVIRTSVLSAEALSKCPYVGYCDELSELTLKVSTRS